MGACSAVLQRELMAEKSFVDGIEAGKTPVSQLCGHVGLVFQNPFNQLSGAKDNVYEEVAFGMQNLGIPAEEMKERVENALKLLDIWQYRDRNPFDLSGGQMQRVAIASVLVMRPDVMILDEPTSQLDPEGSDEVFRAVETLTNSGITIFNDRAEDRETGGLLRPHSSSAWWKADRV